MTASKVSRLLYITFIEVKVQVKEFLLSLTTEEYGSGTSPTM
jgi:hypothetical protein